jgi:7-cyano-7-deazaguanine synthase
MKGKALVLVSGGMDSATLLAHALIEGRQAEALSLYYGQRHFEQESKHAGELCTHYGVKRLTVSLGDIAYYLKDADSALTNPDVDVPHGHYSADTMSVTVVPNRNMMFLSIAASIAMARKAEVVYAGMHAGDHAIYPDCRPEFVDSLNATLQIAMSGFKPPEILTPFIYISKADIARRGEVLEVPFELTWSCYEGGEVHCGRCGTCVERAEAFAEAGVTDPTEYADPNYWKEAVSAKG